MAGLLWYRSYMDSLANTSGYYPDIHAGHADRVTELTLDVPYLVRETPAGYNQLKLMELVGGSVAWNQLVDKTDWPSSSGLFTNNGDGSITANGTASGNQTFGYYVYFFQTGHIYLVNSGNSSQGSSTTFELMVVNFSAQGANLNVYTDAVIKKMTNNTTNTQRIQVVVRNGYTVTDLTWRPQIVDLTAYLGPTIADYVYSLEQATAGSGIAWLKKYDLIDDQYHAYSAPTLQSVEATSHVTKDANNAVIATYPLDSDLVLRGIPKLSNGNLYYDGDTYEWDGTVTRKYAELVADGSNIYNVETLGSYTIIVITVSGAKYPDGNQKSDYLPYKAAYNEESEHFYVNTAQALIFLLTSKCGSTVESVASYLQSNPLHIIYELAAPTTESADPYTAVQTVEDGGTEKFVTTNGVPVGNVSIYRRA